MQVIYRANNIVDLHLVKDALEQAGVPTFANGEYLIGGVGQLPARDFLTLSVPDTCVTAALPVVREISAMLRAPLVEPGCAQPTTSMPPKPAST